MAVVLPHAAAQGQVTRSFTEPYEQSQVAAGEPGVVSEILVVEGQFVEAGQILAKLDHAELQHALRLAELRSESQSRVKSATSMLSIRKRQRENIEPLLAAGHANPAEVEKAVSEYEVAVADLELAQEEAVATRIELERIRAKLDRRFIRSPIDGVVTEFHCHLGEYIAATEPRFATVVRLDRLLARFYLTPEMIGDLNVGVEVPLKLGLDRRSVVGSVAFISPVTDPESGTTRVDVVLENEDGSIRSGSPCDWPSNADDGSLNHSQPQAPAK